MGLFSKFKKKVATVNENNEVHDYVVCKIAGGKYTTRDLFAKDALAQQAYPKLVQALQKELGCGQFNPEGKSNFEWNAIAHYVMTTVSIRDYYEKTVYVTLGVNCSHPGTSNAITISVNGEKANIPLDPIPDNEKDASFIYENTAKKVNEYLITHRLNSITF